MASTSLPHSELPHSDRPLSDHPELEELHERLRARGRSVAAAVDALGGEVRHAADWRTHAARHPFWALGISAAAGLCVASLLRRRARPEARILEAAAGGLEGLAARMQSPSRVAPALAGTAALLVGATRVLAGRALRRQLSRYVSRVPDDSRRLAKVVR